MRVAKWGNSLAVRIPKDVAEALGLKEGDEVELAPGEPGVIGLSRRLSRPELIQRIRDMARPLPEGYKFDREEANAR
nr:AbrB/MazE/SpoVT family DNA-binding domain-containing protein [uncultured Sphingosinicella sp.]